MLLGKIYLDRDMSDNLYWGLPGGNIKSSETIHMAISRVAKKVNEKIKVGDVEPITIIKNKFTYCSETVIHIGIAFMVRLRNEDEIDKNELNGDFIEMNEEEFDYINRFASKEIIKIYKTRFQEIKRLSNNDFQEEEIETNEKYKNRYKIHNDFMKRFILTPKRKKKEIFKGIIENSIKNAKSIIDVSCGEDQFIFNLSREKNIPLVVGNDISWSQIEMLNKKFDEVIFTNHNAAALPFVDNIFDIAYCSNTLHHMPNKKTLISVLESMYKVSKKIIIVEIEDPKQLGGFPLWLNQRWFIGFLKDVGGAYLSKSEFSIIINKVFKDKANVEINEFRNIMGRYMIAKITKEEENVK